MTDHRTGSLHDDAPAVARYGPGIALALLLSTPFLMIASREIPATMLVAVTALLAASAFASGQAGAVLRDLRAAVSTRGGAAALALVALVALAALSVAWLPTPVRGATHALHFGRGLLLAAIAIAVVRRMDLRVLPGALALALGAAAAATAIDLASGKALRATLSLATEEYRLNRVAVAIALFLPLATALLVAERRFLLLAASWALGIAAIALSSAIRPSSAFSWLFSSSCRRFSRPGSSTASSRSRSSRRSSRCRCSRRSRTLWFPRASTMPSATVA